MDRIYHIMCGCFIGHQFLGMIPFWRYFWIRLGFAWDIHSDIFAFSKQIFNGRPSLSWTDVIFYKTRIYVCSHGRFPVRNFFQCGSEWFHVFYRLRTSSTPCNSFIMLLIHSAYLLFSFCSHILVQNCFASFVFAYWFVLLNPPPTCWLNFLSLF